jgi:hypothetical protein
MLKNIEVKLFDEETNLKRTIELSPRRKFPFSSKRSSVFSYKDRLFYWFDL